MDTSSTVGPTSRKLIVHTVLSLVTFVLGVAMLIYMITVEDEPGAVPLGLIVLSIGWYLIARARLRPRTSRKTLSP